MHHVSGGRLIGFTHITVAIGSAAHHADLARVRPVSFTAARSLQDLRPLVFGNHPLELHEQWIFGAVALQREIARANPILQDRKSSKVRQEDRGRDVDWGLLRDAVLFVLRAQNAIDRIRRATAGLVIVAHLHFT